MSQATAWMKYLQGDKSDIRIARETGIPRSTWGFVRRGERSLPSQFTKTLRNAYQKSAYTTMREIGFSSHQARRFSSYSPQAVQLKEALLKSQINRLSIGVATRTMDKMDRLGIPYNADNVWQDAIRKVTEGTRLSRKSLEDILEY